VPTPLLLLWLIATAVAPSNRADRRRRWASVKDTAAYLGVTPRTIRLMVADGRLVQHHLGARITRFDLDAIDAALIASTSEPAPQPPQLRGRPAPVTPEPKVCSRCGAMRPGSDYGPDRRAADGLRSACRLCETADARGRYRAGTGSDPA